MAAAVDGALPTAPTAAAQACPPELQSLGLMLEVSTTTKSVPQPLTGYLWLHTRGKLGLWVVLPLSLSLWQPGNLLTRMHTRMHRRRSSNFPSGSPLPSLTPCQATIPEMPLYQGPTTTCLRATRWRTLLASVRLLAGSFRSLCCRMTLLTSRNLCRCAACLTDEQTFVASSILFWLTLQSCLGKPKLVCGLCTSGN